MQHKPFVVGGIVFLVALLLACGSGSTVSPTTAPAAGTGPTTNTTASDKPTTAMQAGSEPTAAPEATEVPTEAPAPTAAPAAEPGTSRSAPLPLGTEIRGKEWSITIMGITRGEEAAAALKKANQFNDPPAEGMQFLLADVKVVNIGTKPEAQMPEIGVDVRLTGDRNILYGRASAVVPKPFKDKLLPKGEAEGQVAFLVPADEKNLMFRVGELFSFDEEALRYVAVDPDAKITPPTDLASVKATDVGTSKDAPAKVGDVVTTESYEVKILEFVRGEEAAAKIKEANQFNEAAPAGMEYVAIKVHVRYLNAEKPDSTTSIDGNLFKVSGEKNVEYDRPGVVPPEPRLDITAFPGGEAEGWVSLAVASDEKSLVVTMKPLLSFSDNGARYIALS